MELTSQEQLRPNKITKLVSLELLQMFASWVSEQFLTMMMKQMLISLKLLFMLQKMEQKLSTAHLEKLIPETLQYIQDNYGVLIVAASGNSSLDIDKTPTYPASHKNDNLLIVASSTSSNFMSRFSNYGINSVDVAAPGSGIFSTTPNNSYESLSGTSMASPTTAGVAAEVLSHYPNLSPIQLKNVIINSVTKVERFKDKLVSGGRIDLLNALELARTIK